MQNHLAAPKVRPLSTTKINNRSTLVAAPRAKKPRLGLPAPTPSTSSTSTCDPSSSAALSALPRQSLLEQASVEEGCLATAVNGRAFGQETETGGKRRASSTPKRSTSPLQALQASDSTLTENTSLPPPSRLPRLSPLHAAPSSSNTQQPIRSPPFETSTSSDLPPSSTSTLPPSSSLSRLETTSSPFNKAIGRHLSSLPSSRPTSSSLDARPVSKSPISDTTMNDVEEEEEAGGGYLSIVGKKPQEAMEIIVSYIKFLSVLPDVDELVDEEGKITLEHAEAFWKAGITAATEKRRGVRCRRFLSQAGVAVTEQNLRTVETSLDAMRL